MGIRIKKALCYVAEVEGITYDFFDNGISLVLLNSHNIVEYEQQREHLSSCIEWDDENIGEDIMLFFSPISYELNYRSGDLIDSYEYESRYGYNTETKIEYLTHSIFPDYGYMNNNTFEPISNAQDVFRLQNLGLDAETMNYKTKQLTGYETFSDLTENSMCRVNESVLKMIDYMGFENAQKVKQSLRPAIVTWYS